MSTKLDRHAHGDVSLNNTLINEVQNHKHLGLVLANNLSWTSQIDDIYVKAMKRLDIIQHFQV